MIFPILFFPSSFMGTRIVSVLSLLAVSLNATAALAAEPTVAPQPFGNRDENVDISNAYEPEAVYVTRLAARAEDGNVTGSFTIENTEETLVTGLQYRIELRGIEDEEGLPYGMDVVRASIALAPHEQKTLLIASPLPNVPAGRYDLRVQLLTAKGRSLGWQDTPVVVTPELGASAFVKLIPGTIGIAEYGDQLIPPLSGPNVDASTSITLRGMAINDGDSAVRVKPVLELYDFNAARVSLASYEYNAINVGAGEQVPLNMPLTTEASPGVYMAHVTLKNADTNETISTLAQYRFVVRGEDADIVAVRIENMGTKAGDYAYGTVDLAGAADAETTTTATLRVQLLDSEGVLGSIEVPAIELTDSILTARIRIPLNRDMVGAPTVDASLLSASNATFDHAVYAGTLTPAQVAGLTQYKSVSNWVAWHGVARVSLFAFVMLAIGYALFSLFLRLRGTNSLAFTRTATAAFMLVCFATQITSGFAAGSGGIQVLSPVNGSVIFAPLGNRPIIALFVNSPVHGQANNFCNRQINLSYRLEYGVCENQIAYARVLGRVTKQGGHLTAYDVPGTQWETVHNRAYTSDLCTQQTCWASDTFNGTIDLTNVVDANANTATLQLVAKYGKNIAIPDSSFERTDTFIALGWAHGLNVHLQCEPQVGCVDVLKETFDDQNNRMTPVPQFTFKIDGQQTAVNNGQGIAHFSNVTPGTHTISEIVPAGWDNFLVTPTNGTVQVAAGNNCAAVVFKNRQAPQVGCIEILKEGFDSQNNRLSTLPAFSFKLDGNQTIQTDSQGRARFSNVAPGTHSVSEIVPAGWDNFLVTPTNGTVQVTAGQSCAGVTFKNRQQAQDADLQITKTGPSSVVRGSTATYSIVVKNNGPASAPNVIVGDPVPAGTTFAAGQSDNRCTLQGNSVFCNLGTMAPQQQISLSITLNVPNPNPQSCQPGQIVNRAAVQSDLQDRVSTNNESSFTTQVTCPAPQFGCIDILKEGFDAQNNRVTTLPAFTFKLDGNQTVQTDAQGVAHFTNVTPGQHTVTENALNGWTLFNTTPANGVLNVDAGTSCAAVVFKNRQQPTQADLLIQKSGPTTAVRGTNLSYSIVVKNLGPASAPNVIVGDPLPAGTTFVVAGTDSRCTLQGNSVFCDLGTMTAQQQISLTIVLKSTLNPQSCTAGPIVNRAGVQSDLQDPVTSNNEASFTTQMTCPEPQIGCIDILKEGFDAGGSRLGTVPPFMFTLDGTGAFVNSNSQGIARFSNVPAGVHTVTERTASGWTLFNTTPTGGIVNVPVGPTCAAVVFKNRQQPQNADVSVVKTGPATAVFGGNLTYSLTVTNTGPATAQNVIVEDVLPQGLTNPVVSGQGCAVNNGVVRCQVATMPVGEQRIITINVQTPQPQTNCQNQSITNTGTVTSQNDNASGNNQSSLVTQLTCPNPTNADLQITKTGPALSVRGSTVTYQLLVKNNGPASAPNVIVGDPLPAGTTFNAGQSDSRCTLQGNAVFCNLGTMTVGQQITLSLTLNTVNANPQTCQAGPLVNQAAVQSDLQDTNLANNQSSFTTQMSCPNPTNADVSILKTGPASVLRGSNITYQLSVTNNGPATASGVVVTDAVPTGLTYVSSGSGCTINNNTISCQIGTIPATQTRTVSLTFATQPVTGTCVAGSVTNTGVVTTTSNDQNGQNNQSTATTQLTCDNAQLGCVDIVKETFDMNGSLVTPVTQFTFSLDGTRTAVNGSDGRARFENVPVGSHTVTETIPTGWTQQSVTPANGTVTVSAGSCVTVNFKNRQTGTTTEDFSITKTDHETEVDQGDTLEYEIRVRNLSSVRVTNVTVTDTLPDEVDFQDASPTESSENGRVIRWENQTFEPNEEKIYRVEVEVEDDADGTLLNTAEVRNKTATDRTDIRDENDEDVEIDLTKTASTSEVFPGGIIDYTVRVRNAGDGTLRDLTVIDNLPADVIIIDDGDADDRSGRRLEWEIDELEEGDEETFHYRVSVPTYMVAGQVIRNNVCVESDDDNDLDECESVTVSVLGQIPKTGASVQPHESHLTQVADKAQPGDGTLPFLAVIALAGVASGAGLGFGRRFLFGA